MLATLNTVVRNDFDVLVAAPPQGALAKELADKGVDHLTWSVAGKSNPRRPLAALRSELQQMLARVSPDLVHANSLSTSRLSGPVISDRQIPSLAHLRDIVKLSRQAIDDINCHTRIAAVSLATRDFHIARGVDADKTVVLSNGVDLNLFRPRPRPAYIHRELGLPASACLIVTIGQLGLRKATDVALKAARQIIATLEDVHWLIVGQRTSEKAESRSFEARLHAMAAEKPLAGHVHFLGSRADVPHLLAECELLVHTARQEPLGRVLLEAAACGLPVVATNAGGTSEIFPSEADGAVVVPIDDVAAIGRSVIALLNDDARRRAMIRGARRRAEQAFDINTTATELVATYRRILDSQETRR